MIGFTQTYNSSGGNQDLESVLGFGDRPVKVIDANSPLVYDDVFIDFIASDAKKFITVQLEAFIFLLNSSVFQDDAETVVYNENSTVGYIQVGVNVKVIYNGTSILTDDLINIPAGSKAILKKLYNDSSDVFGLTFENVIYEFPIVIHNLAQVLEYGDRDAYTGFPLASGNLDLTPTQRYQTVTLTNATLTEDKIIWIDQTCAIPQAEYKIANTSDFKVQLKPKDGVTFFGDNFFIPKNSVAVIKCIQQFVNGQIVNFRSFLVTFEVGGATPQVNYSETEKDTGIKWLNNKPIYQKTFVFNVTVGGVFIDTSSIGIEKCIKLESTFNDGGAIYPLPYTLFDNSSVTPSNIIFISKYSMEDGAIVGQFTYNVGTVVTNVSGEFIVTMYYTKI